MSIKRFIEGMQGKAEEFKKEIENPKPTEFQKKLNEQAAEKKEISKNEKLMREAGSLPELSKIILNNDVKLEKKLPSGEIKVYETIDLVNAIESIRSGVQGFEAATRVDNFRDIVMDLYERDEKALKEKIQEHKRKLDEENMIRNVNETLVDEEGNPGPQIHVYQKKNELK